jgi:hypothetical protein
MNYVGTWSLIFGLLIVVFVGSASNSQAQDLFRDMDQVKRELSSLRNEVSNLRNLVYDLRSAVLKLTASQDQSRSGKAEPKEGKEEPAPKPEGAADEKQVTKDVCQAVGRFFTEVETILRAPDSSIAEEEMRKAFRTMNSTLQSYATTHRVSKLLNIYEGLAWDAYVAVELRQGIQGNQEFIEALKEHKRKYLETCPKD